MIEQQPFAAFLDLITLDQKIYVIQKDYAHSGFIHAFKCRWVLLYVFHFFSWDKISFHFSG